MIKAKFYYDPTEFRQGSLLPQSLINLGEPLPDLEKHTKADLFITLNQSKPLPIPSLKETWLREACQSGMLIQRKHGMDYLNSIPHLTEVITTMFQWSKMSWLSIVGDIRFNQDGFTEMRSSNDWRTTGWTKVSVKGSLQSWQLSGGMYDLFSTDDEFTEWITGYVDGKLYELLNEEKIIIRGSNRNVTFVDDHILNTLQLTPKGIGYSKIKNIVDCLRDKLGIPEKEYPSPFLVLHVATNEEMQKYIGLNGWGKASTQAVRDHWMMSEYDRIDVVSGDVWLRKMDSGLLSEWFDWLWSKPGFDKNKMTPFQIFAR